MISPFIQFLTNPVDRAVIAFVEPRNQSVPALTFDLVFANLRFQKKYKLTYIDCKDASATWSSIEERLQLMSIGSHTIFVIKNMDLLSLQNRARSVAFLESYTGPHRVICIIDEVMQALINSRIFTLVIPEFISLQEFGALVSVEGTTRSNFIKKLYGMYDKITLSAAFSIIPYCLFIIDQESIDYFLSHWVRLIAPNDGSLQRLSALFFAKNSNLFFQEWQLLCDKYPAVFWTSYWSEQLFRAIVFLDALYNKRRVDKKTVSVRLPYSFIHKDYKTYQITELILAHANICAYEQDLKNGGSDYALDVFYGKFMQNYYV